MSRIFVADASPLIVLENIGELHLLEKLFGEIFITGEVESEFGRDLPEWIKVLEVREKTTQTVLNLSLGIGEASAIALCLENANSLLIIDEKKGRRIAKELGLQITGTLGVIVRAKEKRLLDSIETVLEKLENAKFRISPRLKTAILNRE